MTLKDVKITLLLLAVMVPALAAAQDEVIYEEDIVYGSVEGTDLIADVAYPRSGEKLPAIISVHGGRWRAGNKRDRSTIDVKQWAGFGFFAMSIDYRLVEAAPAPACYQDLQCAIRFVHAHADQYHVDPARVFLIGQSAGGHLVSLAATIGDGPWPRTGGWNNAQNDVQAVISVAACYELPTLSWGEIWTPAGQDLLEARKAASPVYHVHKDMTPILIIHADNDRSVPVDNALLMVEALKQAEAVHVFHRSDSLGHMGIIPEVIDWSRAFIKEHSKDGE